jgi:hypothetical protein
MTLMWSGSLGGVRQFIGEDYESCTRAGAGTGGARRFRQALVHYEAFDRRAHRCKSSAAQINLFGAALTALRQAKAAEQNGGTACGPDVNAGYAAQRARVGWWTAGDRYLGAQVAVVAGNAVMLHSCSASAARSRW